MNVTIKERRKVVFDLDGPNGEFGRVHPVEAVHEVIEIGSLQILFSGRTFRGAEKWALKNGLKIVEVS